MGNDHTIIINLDAIAARIRAAGDVDQVLDEFSQDICNLFEADRLTVYRVN